MSNTYHQLAGGNFSQDWTDASLLSVDDNWDLVPSIIGYLGGDITSSTGIDPQTLLVDGTVVPDVNVDETNPNTFTSGGVAEFAIANPTVALNGSASADAPNLVLHLDATGRRDVTVSYTLRDLDGSADNAVQPVALQYRIGETGAWTNVPAGFVADATSGPSLATLTTEVSAVLPEAVNGQAQVQVRIITANAVGNDEWVGVDNIAVTSAPAVTATAGVTVTQSGGSTVVAEGGATDGFTLVLTSQPTADVTITLTPDAETTLSATSVTFTPANWDVAQTVTVTAVDDATDEQPDAHPSSIAFVVTSDDPDYAGLAVPALAATVQDNDTPLTLISAIQGTAATQVSNPYAADVGTVDAFDGSPLRGQIVTIEAIVVGDFQTGDADASRNLQGFYVQEEDEDADGSLFSSEGIFVFDPNFRADVQIGDKVRITGRVDEFVGETQLNIGTSITGSSVQVVSSGNTLPNAAVFALPAANVTENQDNRLQPDLEAYEGMLVTLPETLTVTEQFQLDRFNEIKLFATTGFEQTGPDGTTIVGERPFNFAQYNEPDVAAFQAYLDDLAKRTITYDDGLNLQNQPISGLDGFEGYSTATAPRMGDTITGLTGVLDYKSAGNAASGATWRIRSTEEGVNTFVEGNPRPAETVLVDGTLKVASFNVLNFFTTIDNNSTIGEAGQEPRGANNATELARQLDKLVDAVLGLDADILGLIEVENDFIDPAGETTAIQTLVDALNAVAGAGTYAYVNPGVDQVGGDAIAVALIYRADKVQVAPGTAPALLTDADVAPELLAQSTTGGIFALENASRVPLAVTFQELTEDAAELTVVVNHLKSKSGTGTGADADQGDGSGNWTNQRELAVQALTAWLETNPTGSDTPNTLLIGDFNAYAEETAIDLLTETAGYIDIAAELLELAYSFVFDATIGTLDYAFASLELFNQVVDALEWHINADEADALDYNTDFGRETAIFDGDSPFRASDHDPIVVGFALDGVDPTLTSALPPDGQTGVGPGANITLTFSENVKAGVGGLTLTNGEGDTRVIAANDPTITYAANTVTINPSPDLVPGTTYDVLVETGAITDLAGNAFAGLAENQLEFTVAPTTFTLQILHASDFEAGLDAVDRAGNFAAIVDYLEETYENSITLSSGDNYLPSPFFAAGSDASLREVYETALEDFYDLAPGTLSISPGFGTADISILNIIGVEASAIGNHEFDAGTNPFAAIIRQTSGYPGAQFPYLSANIDFSQDPNLNPLFNATIRNAEDYQGFPPAAGNGTKIAPATIINENGERIGVVGATTQIVESISSTGGIDIIGDDVNDMPQLAAILQPTIDALIAQGINKVILVSHLQQIALEKELAGLLRGVDVIIAGGSNTLQADATDVLRPGDTADETYPFQTTDADGKPILVVNTDGEYSYVGRLVVEFDENGEIITESLDEAVNGAYATTDDAVADLYADLIDIDGDGDLDSDPFVSGSRGDLVRDIAQGVGGVIDAQDGNTFGQTAVYLEGRRGEVRTEETNLGNLTADANLWYAQQVDETVTISIKNGGGIRDSIGRVQAVGGDVEELPPLANPEVGKDEGEVSQLDIANALRFNNALTLVTLTPEQVKIVLEHAVADVGPGRTPGQFAQVGGISYSFDPTAQAQVLSTVNGAVTQVGQRIQSAVILADNGEKIVLVKDGQVVDSAPDAIRVVTLNFLVNDADGNGLGGDNYPFARFIADNPTFANRVDLAEDTVSNDDPGSRTGAATFTDEGFEQDALAEYLAAEFGETPFADADGGPATDERIQNLAFREDTVLPNEAPVTVADTGTAGENETQVFDVLANDSDPEEAALALAAIEVTAVAGLALTPVAAQAAFSIADDKVVFTPGSLFDGLNSGQTATVTLRYSVTDGEDATDGTLTLTVTGETDYVLVNGDDRANTITVRGGNQQVEAGAGSDLVRTGDGFDLVNAGRGNDDVFGQNGNDILNGQDGNDLLSGGADDDLLNGDAGNDDLRGDGGNDVLNGGTGNDDLRGGEDNDKLYGDSGNDDLHGGNGDDALDGGTGNDDLFGGDGNDAVSGGTGNDLLRGGDGDDVLAGDANNDDLFGGDGNDGLSGGSGSDELRGGDGEDVLNGGSGNDDLFGGDDADLFVFNLDSGDDRVFDFDQAEGDQVQLVLSEFADFADLLATGITDIGRDVAITYSNGARLVLARIDDADLTADDFLFV